MSGILHPDPAPDRARNYCYLFPRFYVGETGEKYELCPVFHELCPESGPGPCFWAVPGSIPPSESRVRKSTAVSEAFCSCPARVVRHSSDPYLKSPLVPDEKKPRIKGQNKAFRSSHVLQPVSGIILCWNVAIPGRAFPDGKNIQITENLVGFS